MQSSIIQLSPIPASSQASGRYKQPGRRLPSRPRGQDHSLSSRLGAKAPADPRLRARQTRLRWLFPLQRPDELSRIDCEARGLVGPLQRPGTESIQSRPHDRSALHLLRAGLELHPECQRDRRVNALIINCHSKNISEQYSPTKPIFFSL